MLLIGENITETKIMELAKKHRYDCDRIGTKRRGGMLLTLSSPGQQISMSFLYKGEQGSEPIYERVY